MTSAKPFLWEPERTWVVIIGTLSWKHSDQFDPFPKVNRRDAALAEYFSEHGVPTDQIVYLQDKKATTARIQQTLESLLPQAKADDLLILYYCGHGFKTDDGVTYFASYDAGDDDNPGWLVDSIPATIERFFGGSHALLLVDCCYSGYLGDALKAADHRVAYACLTSSLASELSTGNWTFTEALLYGLRGHAFVDVDSDNSITLQELANQMVGSMAFAEEQVASFVTTSTFDPAMIVAHAKLRRRSDVGRRVEVRSDGAWYPAQVIDTRNDELKVHFYGYEESDDEWVTTSDIREVKRPVYPVGKAVEVKWKQKWYAAKVLDVRSGIHYIKYDGFGQEWNEWVAHKRIRLAE